MSLKRIISIFRRDLKSSIREFLLLYIMLAPIILAVMLRFFIPGVNSISFSFALDKKLGDSAIMEFMKYGRVEVLDDRQAVEERVKKIDDTAGVTVDESGNCIILLQGNELESTKFIVNQVLSGLNNKAKQDYKFSFSSVGSKMPPVNIYGGVSMIILAITLGGMGIGFNMVEEKESGTVRALSVSPMRKTEFIAGKSLTGVILPVAQVYLVLWILGITNINYTAVFVLTIVSSLLAIILGFLMGILSGNQMAAIANMKFLFLLVSGSVLGAILIPAGRHYFLYWSPFYWSTIGFIKIITNEITWPLTGRYCLWIISLTFAVFLTLKNRIRKGLS